MGAPKAHGHAVRAVSRAGKSNAPPGVDIVIGDAMDLGWSRRVCVGASVVHCSNAIDYQLTLFEDERALGQRRHGRSAPARPTREVVEEIHRIAGRALRVHALASWMVGPLAAIAPTMRELAEMRLQWDQPYLVDHSKFAAVFLGDFTPSDAGLRETLSCWRSMLESASVAA